MENHKPVNIVKYVNLDTNYEARVEVITLAALGYSVSECIQKLREKYPNINQEYVRKFLARKKVRDEILVTRAAINKDIERIPIANRAVQVRLLGEILEKQRQLGDKVEENRPQLSAQLLNDARNTIKQIAEIAGVMPPQQYLQDNRSQTNIITAILGDKADIDERKKLVSKLSELIEKVGEANIVDKRDNNEH